MSAIESASIRIFIVVPPGFERLAMAEITYKFPEIVKYGESPSAVEVVNFSRGGISLEVPEEFVPELHYRLKIPTSIRERLYEFKCRDFPKLFNKIQALPWRNYLVGDAFELSVSAEKSRLANEKRISQTVSDGIHRYFAKQPPKKATSPFTHKIYVRFTNDVCTLSRDLSGQPLFQRGYKEMSAIAPLRENLAAALNFALSRACGPVEALIDPMCGSGTLLFEAWLFGRRWNRQTSVEGDYAFLHDERWQSPCLQLQCSQPNEMGSALNGASQTALKYFGFDRDESALQAARSSAKRLGCTEAFTFLKHDLFSEVSSENGRLPLNEPKKENKKLNAAVILNPPYGERIKLPMPPQRYYPQLLDRVVQNAPNDVNIKALGVVIPKAQARFVANSVGPLERSEIFNFQNGGLDVQFHIFLSQVDKK